MQNSLVVIEVMNINRHELDLNTVWKATELLSWNEHKLIRSKIAVSQKIICKLNYSLSAHAIQLETRFFSPDSQPCSPSC